MNVWLVEIGEPLPTDPGPPRPMRTGLIADAFAAAGHQVVWWASRFDHARREDRPTPNANVAVHAALTIQLLTGCGYARSVSWRRIKHHVQVAADFERRAASADRPDLIVCCVPTLELAAAAVNYGAARGIPVVLDLRDLWPDVFVDVVPLAFRSFARLLVLRSQRRFAVTCRTATALVGITEEFLQWGLGYSGRERSRWDCVVPHAYPESTPDLGAVAEGGRLWDSRGVDLAEPFVITFVGTLSRRLSRSGCLQDAVAALALLADRCPNVKLVICGGGEDLARWQAVATTRPNVVVSGRVEHAELRALLSRTRVGLVPYPNTPDFARSIPNKVGEYLSRGVPVISSVDGALGRFLRENKCGITYSGGDPRGLADIVASLHDDQSWISRLSIAARRAFEEHLSATVVYPKAVRHFEELVKNRQPSIGREGDEAHG